MLRVRFATPLLFVWLLPGCASAPVAENVSQSAMEADYADCEAMSYVSTAGIRAQGAADAKRQELIDTCMKHKGYTVK